MSDNRKETERLAGTINFLVVVAGISFVVGALFGPRDSTDPPGRLWLVFRRMSGLTLYRDHLTGCEYVSVGGGLTPRLGADGKQLCRGDVESEGWR